MITSLLVGGLCACTKQLELLRLVDLDEEKVRVKERSDDKPAVFIFLSTDCPICQKYSKTLRELASSYPSVKFVGVMTKWEKPDAIRQFIREYELPFPVLQDKRHRFLVQLQANVTPEVFFFNESMELLYSGAIDNWFFALGKHRPASTENYLIEAIEAWSRGEAPKISRTTPIGCVIEQ
ncbi:MAG: redoxin domain-containing protein [Saprospiraceae bacterium]